MNVVTRVADKTGALGSVVSAMGCGACFPAIASLGAALGLGFLSRFEVLFITVLLPLFAALALVANALGWFGHRQWHRSVLGVIGPVIVLAASFTGAEMLLYAGLAAMVAVSVWDLAWPAHRRCGTGGCEVTARPS